MIKENSYIRFKLPTEAALCQKYGVSRTTARKALSILEEEHLIERRQGSGSYATGLSDDPEQNVIAVLLTSDIEYIYPRLLTDIRKVLREQNFSTVVYTTENQIGKEREILQKLLEKPVRGILTEGCKTALPSPNADLYLQLRERGVSILFFHGNYSNLPDFPSIKNDNFAGGYELGKYLTSLGHKKITGVFKSDDIQGTERCFGLFAAMRDENIVLPEDLIGYYDSAQLSALQKKQDTGFLTDFIKKKLGHCTAVVCYNDEIAYWLIKELNYRSLQVPEDISIVCFNNSYLSSLSDKQITTLAFKNQKVGALAAENILKLIRGTKISSQKLPWRLIEGQSSTPPAP